MKTKHIILISLIVLILFTLAMPAAMGSSMAMKPAQPTIATVDAGLSTGSVAPVASCGVVSTSSLLQPRFPIACPSVAWNS